MDVLHLLGHPRQQVRNLEVSDLGIDGLYRPSVFGTGVRIPRIHLADAPLFVNHKDIARLSLGLARVCHGCFNRQEIAKPITEHTRREALQHAATVMIHVDSLISASKPSQQQIGGYRCVVVTISTFGLSDNP